MAIKYSLTPIEGLSRKTSKRVKKSNRDLADIVTPPPLVLRFTKQWEDPMSSSACASRSDKQGDQRFAGDKESGWVIEQSEQHYKIVSATFPLILQILCAFILQHTARYWFGSIPALRRGCKQFPLVFLTFIFPPSRNLIFHLHSKPLSNPLQLHSGAPPTWTGECIGSAEKGLRDAARGIHWQKRPDASVTPTPRSPRAWMNFCE